MNFEIKSHPFTVAAGKYDAAYAEEGEQLGKNYKYIESFATYEEARAAMESCQGLHFIELTYEGSDGVVWSMNILGSDKG